MAHTRECASGSATEHSETHIPVVTVQVQRVSGELVCSVDLKPDKDTLLGVKDNVAYSAGFCTCQLRFVTRGGDVVREGLLVRRWIEKINPDNILHVVRREPHASFTRTGLLSTLTAQLLHEQSYCFKCMRDFGISAKELIILGCNRSDIPVDAKKLRDAGYSLSELVNCFPLHKHPLRMHPPKTPRTLFDSQLQEAGYTACDFRNAGYRAEQLSKAFFWMDDEGEGLTAGELEWEECCAFFSASELADAGYSLEDLDREGFSIQRCKNLKRKRPENAA